MRELVQMSDRSIYEWQRLTLLLTAAVFTQLVLIIALVVIASALGC